MDNKDIANIFLRIADMLEIKNENVFRVRAYRNAAQNIMALARPLKDIHEEDPSLLDNIPGIGKDLKSKIIEMVGTGELGYYDDLMKEFSPGFLEMLNLGGLGPKKIKKLRDELGIENIDALEKACMKGKLADIEGMGARTEEKLLEAIEYFRKKQGRMLLQEADEYADEIVAYLKESGNFKKIEKAGSLRRGRETVGDLDILTTAKDAEKAMEYFVGYFGVDSVIAQGPTKSSVLLKAGHQVDLRVVDDASFGAALVYFTGSQQHNIKIRKLAKNKGYKVNEYGVFLIGKTGKERKIAGKTEQDVYKKLDMEWVPPELREDNGEVEAARDGTLPQDLVQLKDIKGDLHIHSTETDGRATVQESVEAAIRKGYKYIAITDHSKHVKIANGMDDKRILKHTERVRKLNQKTKGIEILMGVEVDILDEGKLDFSDSVLKEMDIVIAAVHSRFSLDLETQTRRILNALDNKYVNILAHPSGRLITTRKPISLDFDRVFKKAAENGVFLEVNTHGERIDLNAANCRRALELGAKVVIGTDSHEVEQLDYMKYGVITARRGWVSRKDVLNTYSFDKMVKALKRA
ncbi:MAG: DNA polymerase/3'-5' exonuclease PolX [Candidatus Tantalella remota]|nr:DNA polymerase/3'-5' exonuclease PolX [Candidatus Tantalella remota]